MQNSGDRLELLQRRSGDSGESVFAESEVNLEFAVLNLLWKLLITEEPKERTTNAKKKKKKKLD